MGSHQKGGPAPPLGSYHSGGYDSIRLFSAVGHIIGTCLPHIYIVGGENWGAHHQSNLTGNN